MLQCLGYISRCQMVATDKKMQALLEQCRINNHKHNLTGILLYNGKGTFMQVLEGDPESLKTVFQNIQQDTRHSHIRELFRIPITQRHFQDWEMGFKAVSKEQLNQVLGYSNCIHEMESKHSPKPEESNLIDSILNKFRLMTLS